MQVWSRAADDNAHTLRVPSARPPPQASPQQENGSYHDCAGHHADLCRAEGPPRVLGEIPYFLEAATPRRRLLPRRGTARMDFMRDAIYAAPRHADLHYD
jgi:hypothetical protein